MAHNDPQNTGAPQLKEGKYTERTAVQAIDKALDGVKDLLTITADFSHLTAWNAKTAMGQDGLYYYKVDFAIQMTCYSAYTKYELIYNGVNYGEVTAEYV